jgi:hypothetical protein
LPLIVVALVVIFATLRPAIRRKPETAIIAFAALVLCAAIPIGSWIFWTKSQFGDLTGSVAKITLLGWTQKPLSDWWQHPIFSLRGSWIFWSDLVASFWRGEVTWQGHSLSWQAADGFYGVSSLVFLAAAMVGLRKQAGLSAFQQRAIGSAILIFVAGVLFLALLSIQFDFGNCIYPSRAHPYFTSGRLLSGALIPFTVAYVYGIAFLLRRISEIAPLIAVGVLVGFLVTSEIIVNSVAFASEHNWFHR